MSKNIFSIPVKDESARIANVFSYQIRLSSPLVVNAGAGLLFLFCFHGGRGCPANERCDAGAVESGLDQDLSSHT